MGYFNDTIAAVLAGGRVNFSYLAEFRFVGSPVYFWSGTGSLLAGGKVWTGLSQLGSITGLEEAISSESAQMTFKLSGAKLTSDLMRIARYEDPATYKGQLAPIWLQFFNDDWSVLDEPFALKAGLMDGIEIDRELPSDDGSAVRSLSLTAENMFFSRRIPPYGNYTDADQRQRYPVGGGGLQFIPGLINKTVPVPW